jgi:SAM-dependent methyltransferase
MSQPRTKADTAKTEALLRLIVPRHQGPLERILVVGCGSGHEAGILAQHLRAETRGIDLGGEFAFDHEGSRPAMLTIMDACALDFDDGSFDLVYSFHALEHIPNFCQALTEMSRVLRLGGTFCVGTPNRSRLVGYIGSSASTSQKLLWNLQDLSCRLSGRWSNEAGAHAGFYADELHRLCKDHFGDADDVTADYYLTLYARHRGVLERFSGKRLRNRLFPCIYIVGRKPLGGARDTFVGSSSRLLALPVPI